MQKNYEVLLGNSMLLFSFLFFFFSPFLNTWGEMYVTMQWHWVNLTNMLFFTVSQFTLYGILKGNKPDFHVAMPPQTAKPFYASLIERFQKSYKPDAIKGRFFFCFLFICFNVRLLCDVIFVYVLLGSTE